MHDKFTERVRKVIYLAREEAARLQHDYIGTEHLLLGVIREGEGIAATVLNNLGVDLDHIRQAVENMVTSSGGTMTIGEIPFTPRAKRVLELGRGGAFAWPQLRRDGTPAARVDPRGRGRRREGAPRARRRSQARARGDPQAARRHAQQHAAGAR